MSSEVVCRPRPTPEVASEFQLVARAQRGEEAAFYALYELHKARVYHLCLRLVKTAREAEGLTRSVFLWVFRQISVFKTDGEFANALQCLALRTALAIRRQRALAPHTARDLEGSGETSPAGPPRPGSPPSDVSARPRRENRCLQEFLELDAHPSFWN